MRGSELDLLYVAVTIFVVSIVAIFAHYMLGEISTGLVAQGAPQYAFDYSSNAIANFNYGIILLTIGFGLAAFVSAFMVRSHPIFFVGSIFGLVVMLLVVTVLANAFDKIMVESIFYSTASTTFSKMFTWVRMMPKIFVVMWGLLVIALFAKWERGL